MALFGKGKKKKGEEGKEDEKEEGAAEEKEKGKGDEKKGEEGKDGDKKESAEGEASAEGEEGAPKKSKKKIIILGILALVVLVGGAGGAYFAGLFGGGGEHAEGESGDKAASVAVFYTMPEFLVNLNATGKSSSFLKTTIILELQSQTDVVIVEANLPRLMDAFNTYLRELRSSDLAGSAGIQRLREELLLRSNKALAPTKINDILFKEIVVQ